MRGEEPQHRRPFQHAIGPPRARLIKMCGAGQYVLARHGQFGARRHGVDLRPAGHFELIHGVEGLLDSRATGEQAVIAHDHRIMRPEIANEPLAFINLNRWAFVVMVADMADETDGGLRQRQEPAFHRRHRHAGPRMRMQHTGDVRPRFMDGAVDHITGNIDAVIGIGLADDVALDVDLHQARRGDFLIEKAVQVDQEVFGAGNPRGDVVVEQNAIGVSS